MPLEINLVKFPVGQCHYSSAFIIYYNQKFLRSMFLINFFMCVCVYVYMCVYICISMYIYMYILCIYTHIHTHTYTWATVNKI